MDFYSLFLNIISLVLSASTVSKREKYPSGNNTDQTAALQFLQYFNDQVLKLNRVHLIVKWKLFNLTEADKDTMQQEDVVMDELGRNATSFAWKDFKNTNKTAYRMFKKISLLGKPNLLSEEKRKELKNVKDYINANYQSAKVCAYNAPSDEKCDIPLTPDLDDIFRSSRDYGELTHFWSDWHDLTGKKMTDKYIRYVELSNEREESNGFSDAGEYWREEYESEDFEEDVEELWLTIKPIYEQLHAYVRRKLRKQYPFSGIKNDGPIPAHLLGTITGLSWDNIFDIVAPYPGKESTDITEMMKKKNITRLDMVKMAEEFFTSLGLFEMTPEFWEYSTFVKPNDTDVDCQASATDGGDGRHVSIDVCTQVNLESLMMVHHEMGHVEYFLHYAKQPVIFRDGANPAFHEAIGDTIALSVRTPEHLKKIGLLEEVIEDKEVDINTLLRTALDKIAFSAYAYTVETWTWRVFDENICEDELNQKWWEMRLQNQGLCPPVRRTNVQFDPVVVGGQYINYFVSVVLEFQFHKALCDAAGHQGPLHKCDIYNSKKAGKLLSDMLSKGSSEHWQEVMFAITNGKTRKMDATPMMEYFSPLIDWLKEQNKNETVGWKSSDPMICP